MKISKPYFFILIFTIATSFSPADLGPETVYLPRLLHKDDLPRSVFWLEARDFEMPGKIYLYGSTIFIVDLFEGVHVIDNHNRQNPVKTGFIHIAGVKDIAVKDSVLYADNATDLVAIDLRKYPEISVIDRVTGVFPEPLPPDILFIPARYSARNRPHNTIITGWFKDQRANLLKQRALQ